MFPEKPLSFKFPTRAFGNDPKERSFKPPWYQKYPWFYYEVTLDKAFCHACINAIKLGNIFVTKSEEALIKTGFQNWKKAQEKNYGLAKDNDSNLHKKTSEV